jgi:hypothetical protein
LAAAAAVQVKPAWLAAAVVKPAWLAAAVQLARLAAAVAACHRDRAVSVNRAL